MVEKLIRKTREVSETWKFLCDKFEYTNLTDKELADQLVKAEIVITAELIAVIRQFFEEQKS